MTDDDKIMLLSFSKSGSNWVRYCIEHFSGQRTPGSKRQLLVTDGPAIIERQHFIERWHRRQLLSHQAPEPGEPPRQFKRSLTREWFSHVMKRPRTWRIIRDRRILLLLRNPLDTYVRVRATAPRALAGYAGNIRVFDACKREKLLVYYEDLMADFSEMGRVLDFIDIPHDLDAFDIEMHRQRSLHLYDRGPDRAQTAGSLDPDSQHRSKLEEGGQKAVTNYLRAELGAARFERYLSRYQLPAGSKH